MPKRHAPARTGWFVSSDDSLNRMHDDAVCSSHDDLTVIGTAAAFLHDLHDVTIPQPDEYVVSWPRALYREHGDIEVLRSHYPAMSALLRQSEGLLNEYGVWTGPPIGSMLTDAEPCLVATALVHEMASEVARTAVLLGHNWDATHFASLTERVRTGFRREFTSASGRVITDSAIAYALAISCGLLDADQVDAAGARLADLVARAGYQPSAGTPVVLRALSDTGHLDQAYRLLAAASSAPCHVSVVDWLHRVVGGIRATAPGYHRVRLAPRPGGGLTSAQTVHDTVRGRVSTEWHVLDGAVRFDIAVPQGSTATVVLPLHPDGVSFEIGAGAHSWLYPTAEQPADRPLTVPAPLPQPA
ncbi:alpha-L-rhamnosidase C-terminal domain-containing protein [Lentzea sp. NPDC051208]|uniref:alpha-L-rhamnosidase-related protein n=1 Tax=Lentzea sp. NPDC051208 TaxID=3154642 RepID=UPI00343F0B13